MQTRTIDDTQQSQSQPAESLSAANAPRSADSVNDSKNRWWYGVVIASIVGVPCGWLLSYAALLPFFIGVFFFALFGLALGAVAFRIAHSGRHPEKLAVIAGTTIIVLATWTVSIVKESRDLPHDMAARALRQPDIGSMTADEFRRQAVSDVQAFIRTNYPPGGTIGYLRWVLTSGRISKDEFPWLRRELIFPQARYLFALRVVLSVGLLAFGVASQTWALHRVDAKSESE